MSKSKRFRISTSYDLKKTHKIMLKRFEGVSKIQTNCKKDGTYNLLFSIKGEKNLNELKNHMKKIKVPLESLT